MLISFGLQSNYNSAFYANISGKNLKGYAHFKVFCA